jgi:hypothetical protein
MVIEAIASAGPEPPAEGSLPSPCHCAGTPEASAFREFGRFARYEARHEGEPADA